MNKVYAVLLVMLTTTATYAHDLTQPTTSDGQQPIKAWNVGAGVTQKLIHLNAEWVNPYGIAYLKAGVFMNADHEPGGQIGFRAPVHLTGTDKNGYYVGAYAGQIDRHWVDGQDKTRIGGGIDLAYVMLSAERISSLSVGIGAGEKLKDRSGHVVADIEPRLQFSYTLSIGL